MTVPFETVFKFMNNCPKVSKPILFLSLKLQSKVKTRLRGEQIGEQFLILPTEFYHIENSTSIVTLLWKQCVHSINRSVNTRDPPSMWQLKDIL